MSLIRHARYLRFRPFPTDSPEGRAAERLRRASWTIVAHAVSSAANVLVIVLSVSWTLPYLGVERFGAWMTIASLVAALSFLDLGVGNGLTNRVAQAASEPNSDVLTRAISGGLGLLAALSLALLLVLAAVAWLLPWEALIKSESAALVDEVRYATVVFAILFALSTFTDGVLRVYHGLQRGYLVFATNAVFTFIGILLLYLATRRQASIPVLVLCAMGVPMLPGLFLWLRLWQTSLFRFTAWSRAILVETPKLVRVGVLFFVLQVGTSLGLGMDSLIVSSTLGASAVTTYAVVQRIYLIATQPMLILNGPLWPAYADADARNDRAFIRKTLAAAGLVTLLYSMVSVSVLAWFSEPLIQFWTASIVSPSPDLVYALGGWAVVAAIANCFAMFMNGVGALRPQVVAVTIIVVVGVPLKFLVIRSFGISAMVAAFAAFFVITLGILYGFSFRAHIMRALGLAHQEGSRQ
jgi:O-antigen/teichoic acid export membrane protein